MGGVKLNEGGTVDPQRKMNLSLLTPIKMHLKYNKVHVTWYMIAILMIQISRLPVYDNVIVPVVQQPNKLLPVCPNQNY